MQKPMVLTLTYRVSPCPKEKRPLNSLFVEAKISEISPFMEKFAWMALSSPAVHTS